MRRLVCSYKNTKERIDKGIDRINIKTLFFIVLGFLGWLVYRLECQPLTKTIENVYNTNYYPQPVKHDTIILAPKKCNLPNNVKTKFVKTKKVNFSKKELECMGVKTYTEQKRIIKTCKLEII